MDIALTATPHLAGRQDCKRRREMETNKAKPLRVVGWICMGLSILILLTSIVLSVGGQLVVGPVLLLIGSALLVVGIVSLAAARKAAGDTDRDTR